MESATAVAARYAIDSKISRFTVRAYAAGVLFTFGHNPTIAIRDFSGEVKLDPDNMHSAAVRLTIKAGSLRVVDNISDKDRREIERQLHDEVLESSRYPEIVYESSGVSVSKTEGTRYEVTVNGNLTLHGTTRLQIISAKVALTGEMLQAFGEFSLHQTDYSIKLVSALAGALKVKDEVKFSFDIVARKQG